MDRRRRFAQRAAVWCNPLRTRCGFVACLAAGFAAGLQRFSPQASATASQALLSLVSLRVPQALFQPIICLHTGILSPHAARHHEQSERPVLR